MIVAMVAATIAGWRPAPFVSRFHRRDNQAMRYSNPGNLKRRAITARAKETTMMDLNACAAKDCGKPRFLDYYVCAEHFAFYAAPQYTDSMLVKVDRERRARTIP